MVQRFGEKNGEMLCVMLLEREENRLCEQFFGRLAESLMGSFPYIK